MVSFIPYPAAPPSPLNQCQLLTPSLFSTLTCIVIWEVLMCSVDEISPLVDI